MFSSIAEKYDLANSVLTLGLDRVWRNKLVRLSSPKQDAHILDCATGTGLLAHAFLKSLGEKGRVKGVDFCENMLAQIKFKDDRLCFTNADVMNLPFSNQTFDITAIAYGLRNLPDTGKRFNRNGSCYQIRRTAHDFGNRKILSSDPVSFSSFLF